MRPFVKMLTEIAAAPLRPSQGRFRYSPLFHSALFRWRRTNFLLAYCDMNRSLIGTYDCKINNLELVIISKNWMLLMPPVNKKYNSLSVIFIIVKNKLFSMMCVKVNNKVVHWFCPYSIRLNYILHNIDSIFIAI